MRQLPQLDTFGAHVNKIKYLFKIENITGSIEKIGAVVEKKIKSSFDLNFLDKINQVKLDKDLLDHNKLRFYKQLKGSFKIEPYIENIQNRSQRAWLSRYRVSAHKLRIETGRYTRPVTPVCDRACVYCDSLECDTEEHFILKCKTFSLKRNVFFGRMAALIPNFSDFSNRDKLLSVLCPSSPEIAKNVSKFLGIMSETRKCIDEGLPPDLLLTYTKHKFNS